MNTASELAIEAMRVNRENYAGSERIRNSAFIVEKNNDPEALKVIIEMLSKAI